MDQKTGLTEFIQYLGSVKVCQISIFRLADLLLTEIHTFYHPTLLYLPEFQI